MQLWVSSCELTTGLAFFILSEVRPQVARSRRN